MRRKNSWCLGIILIFSFEFVSADIRINEVMYDPSCSYTVCEWIELYNDNESSVNMSGWILSDNKENDSLENSLGDNNIIIPGNSFALIVDSDSRVFHNFDVGENTVWVYTTDTTIGNALTDSGDIITIYDNNLNEIDSVSYNDGDAEDGKTWALISGVWEESEPAPGRDNENNESYNNDYSVIEISEFMPNPEGDDDKAMPDGEWVELYNKGNEDLDLFGFKLRDNSEKEVLIDNVHADNTIIKSKKYLVIYMNGAYGFLNNGGSEKIKLYDLNDNLIDEVSYSESKEGVSWSKVDDRWRMSVPSISGENSDEKINNSVLKIEQFYDLGSNKVAEWGDVLRVKVNIYKANSNKNVVYLYAKKDNEKISKETKMNVYEKFSNQTLTLPLQLYPNCDNKFKDGRYDVILEGLDAEADKEEIEIRESEFCKSESVASEKKFEYKLLNYPTIIKLNNEFEGVLSLKNNEDKDLSVDLSSYVYRGKKKYSEENLQKIMIPSGGEVSVNLKNIVREAEEGDYNFKIEILKEGRKTPYEIKKEIVISKDSTNKTETKKEKIINRITGGVVYESSGVKAKRTGIFFFAFCITLLLVYQTWIRK